MTEQWYRVSKVAPAIQVAREDIKHVGDVMLTKATGTREARETPVYVFLPSWEEARALRVKLAEQDVRQTASLARRAVMDLQRVQEDAKLPYDEYIMADLKHMGLIK